MTNIAFIGGGNMATALIGGLLQKGYARHEISVVEVDSAARDRLSRTLGVAVTEHPGTGVANADVVLLAVKPQQLRGVALALRPLLVSQLVLSIAAGIRTADLAGWLGSYPLVIRAMPNTPALVLAGVAALYGMPSVTVAHRYTAESILGAVGSTIWVEPEELMDAVTAVSGSGPAYVFYFIEALDQAARELGLSAVQARQLSLDTFLGAARLAHGSSDEPALLRARVTSKGGTTERALACMDDARVKELVVEAIKQAAQRSRELGEELGAAR
ncbi:MAG TPA: pyrroline-5-carboxylate reductase [Burkholderiales bacterium]|nr:pyrroline-5-carboxylate reductase [Burkholderiales bacterium]